MPFFVAIVRDGYAVCESLLRRGWTIEDAAHLYNSVGREILATADRSDYLILKFEDVLHNPLGAIEQIYSHCGLNSAECEKFLLQHKSVATGVSGKSVLHGDYDRQLEWFDRERLVAYFKPDVNKNQVNRLSADQIKIIDCIAGETIAAFGYGR